MVPNKTMAMSPTAERMRFVLNLPALKRIMSISFRKARAHGSGVGRLRGEGALALALFDESAERLTSKLCRFVNGNQIRAQLLSQKSKRFVTSFNAGRLLSLFSN